MSFCALLHSFFWRALSFCAVHSFEGNHAIHVCCSDVLLMESRDRWKSQDREGTLLVNINEWETPKQNKTKQKCQEALHLLNQWQIFDWPTHASNYASENQCLVQTLQQGCVIIIIIIISRKGQHWSLHQSLCVLLQCSEWEREERERERFGLLQSADQQVAQAHH